MRWRRQKDREHDLEREIRSHLELEAEEQRENGLSPEEARYGAQRALGNTTFLKEEVRDLWGSQWFNRLANDLRYGCRALKNNPGFAAVAVLTAALGIGANTSIFSVVNAVLLRPLPYRDAARLVVPTNFSKDSFFGWGVGDFQYAGWRDQSGIFDGIAAYAGQQHTITGNGEPEKLKTQAITPGFLRMLGVAPIIGRDFTGSDAGTRGGQVALISYSLWQQRFSGDPSVLSKSMTLDGKPYSIAGVLPRDFEFPDNSKASLLLALTEPALQPNGPIYFYNVIGRLKPGISLERAERDLTVINQRLASAYSEKFRRTRVTQQARVVDLHDRLVGNVRPALLILSGAVGLVLLIVCVNVCNLLLARALSRQKEIAVRIALGAGRGRILRQLLTEGMLLASLSGAAGLAVAFGGEKLLRAIAPPGVPHIEQAHIGGAVLAFNLAVAIVCGMLFGLAPMRGASAIDPEVALKQTARAATGTRLHRRVESLLVVAETAFALILLAGAGLLIRTFASLTAIAPGFHPDNVVTARISLPFWKYRNPDRQREFLNALLERARSAPGADAVAAVAVLPYGGFMMTSAPQIEGRPTPDRHADELLDNNVAVNYTAGDYFKAMGIPILEGRALDRSDAQGRSAVAVVNQALVHQYFANGKAIGARIKLSGITDWLEIVGVAGNLKQVGLASETRPEMFQPSAQTASPGSASTLVIRSAADPRVLGPWLHAQIAASDKDIPPPEIETMREYMTALVASQQFVMRLLSLFAMIAITLAGIGIYSVLVYSVERRAHEIGIRLALGARATHIIGMVLGRGLRLSIAGSAIGVGGGLALTRYLKSLLYGVTPHDPMTLALGCAVVFIAALLASYLPARRAVDQDAIATLREE